MDLSLNKTDVYLTWVNTHMSKSSDQENNVFLP